MYLLAAGRRCMRLEAFDGTSRRRWDESQCITVRTYPLIFLPLTKS